MVRLVENYRKMGAWPGMVPMFVETVNKLDVCCRKNQLRLADRVDVGVRVNQVCGFHDQVDGGNATYQIRGNW